MSTAGMLYLVMAIVAVTGFALVVAYYAWQQAKWDRERAAQAQTQAPARAEPQREPVHA